MERNRKLAWFGGIWLGAETVLKVPYFRKMAVGWRFASLLACATVYKTGFTAYNSMTYGPIVSAFFRKHLTLAKANPLDIVDRKREYYDIDTSQYMNYDFNDLGHEYHANHGPQPVTILSFLNIFSLGWRSKR